MDSRNTSTSLVSKIDRLCLCNICVELMFEPFTLDCGHSFCYSCLDEWLQQHRSCPECRLAVKRIPNPSWTIRNIVRALLDSALEEQNQQSEDNRKISNVSIHFVDASAENTADTRSDHSIEILDDASARLAACQAEYARVRSLREKGELFHGLFLERPGGFRAVVDPEDGVVRCGRCNWEVIGNQCTHCGFEFSDVDADLQEAAARTSDFEDDDDDDSIMSFESGAGDPNEYDLNDSFIDETDSDSDDIRSDESYHDNSRVPLSSGWNETDDDHNIDSDVLEDLTTDDLDPDVLRGIGTSSSSSQRRNVPQRRLRPAATQVRPRKQRPRRGGAGGDAINQGRQRPIVILDEDDE